MKERLRQALARLRGQRFWIELGATTAAVLIICVMLGRTAHARGSELEAEAQRLERVVATFDRWRGQFQPATADEAIAWASSEAELRTLGLSAARPITVVQMVARVAEEAGFADARVRIATTDTLSVQPRDVGGQRFTSASFGVDVEFRGSIAEAGELLASLPLAVEPVAVAITRAEGARARIQLAVFETAAADAD